MKRLILLIIASAFVISINAHDYRQFPKSNEKPLWIIKTTYPHLETDTNVYYDYMGMIGDTIINSKTYEKIYYLTDTLVDSDNISGYFGALREELKKIYLINAYDSNEKLVFDFSKTINDTILYDSSFMPPLPVVLTNIDTILLNSLNYVRYTTACGDKWIEGIGNTEWSIFNICPPLPDNGSYTRLCCFKLDNLVIYGDDCKGGNNITSITTPEQNKFIKLFPNPASDYFSVSFNNSADIDSYKIVLLDIKGNVVFEGFQTNNEQIELDHICSGIYIVKIILKDSIINKTLIVNNNKL